MKFLELKKNSGFVILFAVTLTSIILAVALSVANISYNEAKFSTSTRDSDDAFFAADTGSEAVLFLDKSPTPFVPPSGATQTWNYTITGLGGSGNSCAKVTITKDNTVLTSIKTTIISKGYNIGDGSCAWSSSNRVERELDTYY